MPTMVSGNTIVQWTARGALGDDHAFDGAWNEGRAMRVDEAVK